MRLIVTNAFGEKQPGDEITEPKEVATVLASDNAGNVVKTADAPSQEAPKVITRD